MTFHVARDGQIIGEFAESDFRAKIFSGEILPDDHYWIDGFRDWKAVANYRVTKASVPPPIPVPTPPAAIPHQVIRKGDKVCTNCGFVGRPKIVTKGSFATELLLWLCLLLPGILYSVWRLASRYQACPKCEAPNMIPADSPRGKELLSNFKPVG